MKKDREIPRTALKRWTFVILIPIVASPVSASFGSSFEQTSKNQSRSYNKNKQLSIISCLYQQGVFCLQNHRRSALCKCLLVMYHVELSQLLHLYGFSLFNLCTLPGLGVCSCRTKTASRMAPLVPRPFGRNEALGGDLVSQ